MTQGLKRKPYELRREIENTRNVGPYDVIESRRDTEKKIVVVWTLSRMEIDRLPARALYCHVTGERSQGSQAKKCLENIKEDFELRNIPFKDAVASCKDRTAWRQLISSTSSSS